MPKVRSDAKLKTLPPVQQREIWDLCARTSYTEVVGIVRDKFGVSTSTGALSAFFGWYPTSRVLEEAAGIADQLKADLKKLPSLDIDDDKLARIGLVAFEAAAIKRQDTDAFVALHKLRLKHTEHRHSERRIALLEEKAAQAKAQLESALAGVKTRGGLTPETLKQIEEAAALL